MVRHRAGHEHDDARTEAYDQKSKRRKSNNASGQDGQQKEIRPHLEYAGRQKKQFERGRRRQHRRNHHGEEFLAFEAVAHALEALAVDMLKQQQFASGSADSVWNQTAQRRAYRRSEDIKPNLRRVGIDVSGERDIDRNGEGGGIQNRRDEESPWTQRLQDAPDKMRVARENVFNGVQSA